MSEPVQAVVVVDMQRGLLAGPAPVVGATASRSGQGADRPATAAGAWSFSYRTTRAGQVDEPGTPGWELAHPAAPCSARSPTSFADTR
jgi:hypothetical protein